ncbi:MAG: MGMT family protein [Gemmataceae bacterium]|nr:MGMT family protein [Gemmataceae bacterium]
MNFVKPPKAIETKTCSLEFPLGRVDLDVSAVGIHQIRLSTGPKPKTRSPLLDPYQPLVAFLENWPTLPAPTRIPLVMEPTVWQKAVWALLLQIPVGETEAYGAIAKKMGRPTASRAVARACASNNWCLLIPCHRVLGANGRICGFRGGMEWKPKLLCREWEFSMI